MVPEDNAEDRVVDLDVSGGLVLKERAHQILQHHDSLRQAGPSAGVISHQHLVDHSLAHCGNIHFNYTQTFSPEDLEF